MFVCILYISLNVVFLFIYCDGLSIACLVLLFFQEIYYFECKISLLKSKQINKKNSLRPQRDTTMYYWLCVKAQPYKYYPP